MASEDDARRIALSLPGAYQQTSYGGCPSWRTKPRMFALMRDDPDALVVWVGSVEERDALVASDAEKFFSTPHYEGSSALLVRLAEVDVDELRELIEDSWRLRAPRALTRDRQ